MVPESSLWLPLVSPEVDWFPLVDPELEPDVADSALPSTAPMGGVTHSPFAQVRPLAQSLKRKQVPADTASHAKSARAASQTIANAVASFTTAAPLEAGADGALEVDTESSLKSKLPDDGTVWKVRAEEIKVGFGAERDLSFLPQGKSVGDTPDYPVDR